MKEILVKVGIKTHGQPLLKRYKDYTLLENMLIGDGFHWQKTLKVRLPGEVMELPEINDNEKDCRCIMGDNVSLLNIVPLETYLECVVGSEMNPTAPFEFLKAHAVISRSWVLGKVRGAHPCDKNGQTDNATTLVGWDDTGEHSRFDVCSDDHCQRYQGLQVIPAVNKEAIGLTSGEVITDETGNIVDARFSKCCGGRTEVFETCWQPLHVRCLDSVDDPWCDLSNFSPSEKLRVLKSVLKDYDLETDNYGYCWRVEISKDEIKDNLLNRFGRNIGEILKLEPLHRGVSGRIDLLRIHGSEGLLDLGKELWIRRLLSSSHLYSSAFEIEDSEASVVLNGKGWGHGVGLCQIGAANMALNGYSYQDILAFYYPGAILSKL